MDTSEGSWPFVLQAVDPATATASAEMRVFISDLDRLREVLGIAEDDPDVSGRHILSAAEMAGVGALCRPPIVPDAILTAIEPWHSIREVPYLVHTNFELPLMLEGRKPLAFFGDAYPAQWLDDYIAPFGPFVASGRLVRRMIDQPFEAAVKARNTFEGIRTVYFAIPSEEWRIDAHRLLKRVGAKSGWNDALERFEGSLLGYEDWQNDWWIDRRRQSREKMGQSHRSEMR